MCGPRRELFRRRETTLGNNGGVQLGAPGNRQVAELAPRALAVLFPHGGNVARAEFWCGLRPMTPDGTPVLGATRVPNLFLATGHGTLGWTMAAGTGRVLADVISGRAPEVDLDGLTLDRYPNAWRLRAARTIDA